MHKNLCMDDLLQNFVGTLLFAVGQVLALALLQVELDGDFAKGEIVAADVDQIALIAGGKALRNIAH